MSGVRRIVLAIGLPAIAAMDAFPPSAAVEADRYPGGAVLPGWGLYCAW